MTVERFATVNENITRNVWQYFASYVPYWLGQTGHVDSNGNLVGNSTNTNAAQRLAEDNRGIDGLRADFGQGCRHNAGNTSSTWRVPTSGTSCS